MPRLTIRIGLRIGRLGQRAMHLPLSEVSGPVDGRAGERMPEAHAWPELDQPALLGRRPRVASDPEPLGGAPQQAHVADRLGRGQ